MTVNPSVNLDLIKRYALLVKDANEKIERLKEGLFLEQKLFLEDPSKRKVALCTRRAGKSYVSGVYTIIEALKTPGCSVLLTGLSRSSIKRIYVKDIFTVLNRKYKLGMKLNLTELSYTLTNGSVIYLLGTDANDNEIEKSRGQKYTLVINDESASFKTDLQSHIQKVYEPAVSDYSGTICLIGTPNDQLNTYFYKVSTGEQPEWSVSKWTGFVNPFNPNFKTEHDKLLKDRPGFEHTEIYKSEWLGEWAIDKSSLVYKYSPERNNYSVLPKAEYAFVMGVDIGFNDSSSFCIVAYCKYDKTSYVIEAYKETEMIISDLALQIRHYLKKYDLETIVIDGANKTAVQELIQRYNLPLQTADKVDKASFIRILNSDLITSTIKINPQTCSQLVDELQTLIWDEKSKLKGKYIENQSQKNDLTDTLLYAWRYCYSYLAEDNPAFQSQKTEEEKMEEYLEAKCKRLEEESRKSFWEKMS